MTDASQLINKAPVAVVGVGYVGLTLLCALGKAGYLGIGYDIDAARVERIAAGHVPFEGADHELERLLVQLTKEHQVRATVNPEELRHAVAIFIAVETPVDETDHRPRYRALRAALETVGQHLAPNALVVIESTIAPGTVRTLAQPILESATRGNAGIDFHLVHCPERVMPGRLLHNITTYDRVVGGVTPACTKRALAIYSRLTSGRLYPTNALTAEIVKTAENAYRDVQIAFANEMALICEDLGADVFEVRDLVNSSPHRQMHLPGAGVGGHCIPKDPWLLCSATEHYSPRLLPMARAINDSMPTHLIQLTENALAAEGRSLQGAQITVLGAAYLEETDDTRNAPALMLANRLIEQGARVNIIDPFVTELGPYLVRHDDTAVAESDALILVTAHQVFRTMDLAACVSRMRTPILIDGRNAFDPQDAHAAGFRYLGIGKGQEAIERAQVDPA